MSTPMRLVHDCSTGIVTEVLLTADEIAESEAAAARAEERRAEEEAAAEKTAADKASGEAKLADLGLTADEIAALVG